MSVPNILSVLSHLNNDLKILSEAYIGETSMWITIFPVWAIIIFTIILLEETQLLQKLQCPY